MSQTTPSFKFRGNNVPIKFGFKEVMNEFKEMGLPLLRIMKGNEVILTIFMDDEVMIQIWYFFVQSYEPDFEEALKDLDSLDGFKEAFWQATVNFSPAALRGLLTEIRDQLKRELKSPKKFLKSLSYEEPPEQDSLHTTTPSETS